MAPSGANARWRRCGGLFLVDHQHDGETSRQPGDAACAEPAAPPRRITEPAGFAPTRQHRPVVTDAGPRTRRGGAAAAAGALVVDAEAVPSGAVGRGSAGSLPCGAGLTGFDASSLDSLLSHQIAPSTLATNVDSLLSHQIAPSTLATYRSQWRSFAAWAQRLGLRALPADPVQVAAYLAERSETRGHRPATLRVAAAAIAFVHRAARLDDPCASQEVKVTLKSAARKMGRSQKQAEALTAEVLAVIEASVHEPRLGRGGRLESTSTARRRANIDMALMCLMRDALLRVSEAAALAWSDLEAEADATGRLLIRRSKTDPEGEGAVAFVSASTMARLRLVRGGTRGTDTIFGLRPNQIALRIKKAAQTAGFGDGFSGHSPRVGMARGPREGRDRTAQPHDGRPLAHSLDARALHPQRDRRQRRRRAVLRLLAPASLNTA